MNTFAIQEFFRLTVIDSVLLCRGKPFIAMDWEATKHA